MKKSRGFSLIELLIALVALVVILGIGAAFFVQQTNQSRRMQARTEVQDKVRYIMQLAALDLQSVGSNRYVNAIGNATEAISLGCGASCLVGLSSGVKDTVTVNYATSTKATSATACRSVDFDFNADSLRRRDYTCGATAPSLDIVADNILAFNLLYLCSDGKYMDGPPAPGAVQCSASSTSYVRAVRVTVVGRSNDPVAGAQDPSTTISVANSSIPTATLATTSLPCTAGYYCYALDQEVQLPNLKDK